MSSFGLEGLEQTTTIGFAECLFPFFRNVPSVKLAFWDAELCHEPVLKACPSAPLSAKQFCICNGCFEHCSIISPKPFNVNRLATEFKQNCITMAINNMDFFAINHDVTIVAIQIHTMWARLNSHIPNDFAKTPTLCGQLTLEQSHVFKGSNQDFYFHK
jgi:hypothetical protein